MRERERERESVTRDLYSTCEGERLERVRRECIRWEERERERIINLVSLNATWVKD